MVGIFIAIVFTAIPGTRASFVKGYDGPTTEVEAATTKDFIEDMEVYYQEDKAFIRLRKADMIDYSPIIFFTVEGEIEDYISHIDAIALEDQVNIPIKVNVNLSQAISLIISPQEEIKGEIRIKHLNNFIDESLEITISKDYLIDSYFSKDKAKDFQTNYLTGDKKDQMINFVKNNIIYSSSYINWDEVIWEENVIEYQASYSSLPISKLEISSYQSSIIDIIAPKILTYQDRLYSLLELTLADLNSEIVKNDDLTLRNDELMIRNESLVDEISRLEEDIARLRDDLLYLNNRLDTVEKDNQNLNDQILESEIIDENDQLEHPDLEEVPVIEDPVDPEEIPVEEAPLGEETLDREKPEEEILKETLETKGTDGLIAEEN